MTARDNSQKQIGVRTVNRKDKIGLGILALLTLIVTLSLVTFLTPASFGAGPQSLRGEQAIDDENIVNEIPSIKQAGRVTKDFRQQPPLIPHRIDKYEIDLKVNQCMRCHDWPNNAMEGAPKISETHFRDRDGKALDTLYRGRWFCTQCHVTQTDKAPLIANTFEPAPRAQ